MLTQLLGKVKGLVVSGGGAAEGGAEAEGEGGMLVPPRVRARVRQPRPRVCACACVRGVTWQSVGLEFGIHCGGGGPCRALRHAWGRRSMCIRRLRVLPLPFPRTPSLSLAVLVGLARCVPPLSLVRTAPLPTRSPRKFLGASASLLFALLLLACRCRDSRRASKRLSRCMLP